MTETQEAIMAATDIAAGVKVEHNWLVVVEVLRMIQSPKPLDPVWLNILPADFWDKLSEARRTLLDCQLRQMDVPEEVWAQVLPSSRAGLLRNTFTGCGRAYLDLKTKNNKGRK